MVYANKCAATNWWVYIFLEGAQLHASRSISIGVLARSDSNQFRHGRFQSGIKFNLHPVSMTSYQISEILYKSRSYSSPSTELRSLPPTASSLRLRRS